VLCKSLQINNVTCYQKQNYLCHTQNASFGLRTKRAQIQPATEARLLCFCAPGTSLPAVTHSVFNPV
jgi:hypothetical protein